MSKPLFNSPAGYQQPKIKAAKWNSAIITYLIYTCAVTLMSQQCVVKNTIYDDKLFGWLTTIINDTWWWLRSITKSTCLCPFVYIRLIAHKLILTMSVT